MHQHMPKKSIVAFVSGENNRPVTILMTKPLGSCCVSTIHHPGFEIQEVRFASKRNDHTFAAPMILSRRKSKRTTKLFVHRVKVDDIAIDFRRWQISQKQKVLSLD